MDTGKYKDQIITEIKNHLPDTGKEPEKNMSALSINHEYKKNIKAVGKRVALNKHERIHERKVGEKGSEIYIPTASTLGTNLNEADIISLGRDAEKYNLKRGDWVCYDHFSVFYDTHPVVVTNIENIICKIEDCIVGGESEYTPVGKYVEVVSTDISLSELSENIILLEDSKAKYVYKVVKIGTGYEDYKFPVKINDLILIGGNAADDITFTLGIDKKYYIFCDNIIGFVNKEE